MVTRNDYNLNLMNGDIGITLKNKDGKLQVAFIDTNPQSDATIRWVSPLRLSQVETAFAMTVHKSQGSEFSHVVLALPDIANLVLTPKLILPVRKSISRCLKIVQGCLDKVFISGEIG
jgi:exodeoxyribonuclease V alpha subunit